MGSKYWDADRLDRSIHSELLINFLKARLSDKSAKGLPRSYVLNIDSAWGQGKTFFLKGLKSDLEDLGHLVAYVNSWETDFADEPLLATLAAIEDALRPFFRQREKLRGAWQTLVKSGGALGTSLAKNVGVKLAQKYTGDFVDEVADALDLTSNTDDKDPTGFGKVIEVSIDKLADRSLQKLLTQFKKESHSISLFKRNMQNLISNISPDKQERFLFVLVDELDRCRPIYSIRLLEDAKHLFSVDGVVFVVATDTEQLSESVKALYGHSFDSSRYLRRFFDRTYRFPIPDRKKFVEFLLERNAINQNKLAISPSIKIADALVKYFDAFDLSLRDIEQCFDVLSTFIALWPHEKLQIELAYALPLIIAYHRSDMSSFHALNQGTTLSDNFMKSVPLWTEKTGYSESTYRTLVVNTKDLTVAFQKLLNKSLWQLGNLDGGASAYAERALNNEFQILHSGSYNPGKPLLSIIRDYRRYVELSHRFEPGTVS